jgi:CDP-glucose 4,6-dehydratase
MTRFWEGRRVFITGHTGFKGAWLSYWLKQMGAEVFGYAQAPEQTPALYDVLKLEASIPSQFADIAKLDLLQTSLNDFQPEIVFHLAAQSLVKPSYDSPLETYQTNVMGTANLLESVRQQAGVKAVVVVTSDKCYENLERPWPYRETDRLGGHDPYSNSKACAELVTASYRASFFTDTNTAVASVRAGNVIGGGDWAQHRLLPDVIKSWQSGNEMAVRYPGAVRPWQHVLDPLSGYLALAQNLVEHGQTFAEAWNFAPEPQSMQPVRHLLGIAEEFCPGFAWHSEQQPEHHEAQLLMLDYSKAQKQLGWTPNWSLDTALEKTFEWYEAFYEGQDMRDVCDRQIASFLTIPASNESATL